MLWGLRRCDLFLFLCAVIENLLVLVDQHAAHERVRLERLITGTYDSIYKQNFASTSVNFSFWMLG